jgi:hypothetical protein
MDDLEIEERDGVYYLTGGIDENARFGPLMGGSRGGPLKLNLKGVTAANSMGVKIFMNFILDLGRVEIEFHECSVVASELFNTFPAALGDPPMPTRVKSFHAPFECKKCGHEWEGLLTVRDHAKKIVDGTSSRCPKCGVVAAPLERTEDLLMFLDC